MFKVIAFMNRKAGLTRQQFIDYYENNHQKLAREILPPITDYRRNYPVYDDPLNFAGAFVDESNDAAADNAAQNYDVITEMSFKDRNDFEQFLGALRDPEIARRIMEDEDNFLDRDSTRLVVVDEHRSPLN